MKLGLIAGGGGLPVEIAERRRSAGADVFVLRLKGIADPALASFPGVDVGLAELGRAIAALQEAGCDTVCMAGTVKRPDFSALKPDLRGLAALPGAVVAARQGDDALLRFLVGEFEREGFAVVGADEAAADLALREGPLGQHAPSREHAADIAQALRVARSIGDLDIGQGAVVCDGVVLAVEAQEGTDAMLARVRSLPAEIRGSPAARRGVLAKAPKPIQDRRTDLPTVGTATVEAASEAGLAGIVGVAGGLLLVDRAAVAAAADRLGLFVHGEPA